MTRPAEPPFEDSRHDLALRNRLDVPRRAVAVREHDEGANDAAGEDGRGAAVGSAIHAGTEGATGVPGSQGEIDMTDERLVELERLAEQAGRGAWMVCCDFMEGGTRFSIQEHIEPAVVWSPESYGVPKGERDALEKDFYGYYVADDDWIPDHKVRQAKFIAQSRQGVLELVEEVRRLKAGG